MYKGISNLNTACVFLSITELCILSALNLAVTAEHIGQLLLGAFYLVCNSLILKISNLVFDFLNQV